MMCSPPVYAIREKWPQDESGTRSTSAMAVRVGKSQLLGLGVGASVFNTFLVEL